jgi:hypothetical protein
MKKIEPYWRLCGSYVKVCILIPVHLFALSIKMENIFNWHRTTLSLCTVHLTGNERHCRYILTFNWHRTTLSVMYILLTPTGTVATYCTRTFQWHPLTVCACCTVHCIPSFILGEVYVRLAEPNTCTSQAVMYADYEKLGSNFETRKLLSFFYYFLMGVGVGKLSAWLDFKLTLQTKKLSLVQVALYVT